MRYLLCEKCGYNYKLHKGESPDGFITKWEWGGKLEYVKSLADNYPNIISKEMSAGFVFHSVISVNSTKMLNYFQKIQ